MAEVFIGLGSNLGDRAASLAAACERLAGQLDNVVASALYESAALLPDDAPVEWNTPYLNQVIKGDTALEPLDLLRFCQQIESELGRVRDGHWGPRVIDIDVLSYGAYRLESPELTLPHPELLNRDFVLVPLAQIAPYWVYPDPPGQQSFRMAAQLVSDFGFGLHDGLREWSAQAVQQKRHESALMGIINVTPDSFSDGGEGADPSAIIARAATLIAEGATILDIGAESTRPGATPLSASAEWERLSPVLPGIMAQCRDHAVRVSVDTRHAETALRALQAGVQMVNDVSAATNDALLDVVAQFPDAGYVLMHSMGIPADPQVHLPPESDPVQQLQAFAAERLAMLAAKGIDASRIWFDPGIGFGKTPAQNWEIIRRASELKSIGIPVLIGHSRKSFLKPIAEQVSARDAATIAVSLHLADCGIDILRVHAVAAHQQALAVWREIGGV